MFISVEGADYSGKTTMCGVMADYFKSIGKEVLITREPGGTEMGTQIRSILVNEKVDTDPIDIPTQILLLFAGRIHHINSVIIPALEEGKVVISDRFIDSSFVYQGLMYGHSDFIKKLISLTEIQYLQVRPDYTVFYDIDYATMLERMNKRGEYNSLDEKYAKLKERPLDCFKQHFYELQSSKTYGNRIKIVDATKVISTVSSSTVEICKEIMFGGLASDRQYYNRVQALRVR